MVISSDHRKVLVVEDDDDLRELLARTFLREGLDTVTASTGKEAITALRDHRPALLVLDMTLPDLSGTDILRHVRASPELQGTPVVLFTARSEEIDRVVAFEIGADDYVVKGSATLRELVLRVWALLRRTRTPPHDADVEAPDTRVTVGGIGVDLPGRRAWVEEHEIQLTATEFEILACLAHRAGRVLTRATLLERVWDLPADRETRTLDTHVKRLREKLGVAAERLETVRGVGYRLTAN